MRVKARRAERKQLVHKAAIKNALIAEVVNREERTHARIGRIFGSVLQFEKRRGHGGLPVVQMQHIRHKADARQHLQNGLGKIGEALALCGIEAAVNIIPAEVIFVIDKVVGYSAVHKLFYAAILAAPPEAQDEIAHMMALRLVFFLNGFVKRQHDACVRTIPAELCGKRARHIRKAAGFHERQAFACRKKYLQFGFAFCFAHKHSFLCAPCSAPAGDPVAPEAWPAVQITLPLRTMIGKLSYPARRRLFFTVTPLSRMT